MSFFNRFKRGTKNPPPNPVQPVQQAAPAQRSYSPFTKRDRSGNSATVLLQIY